MFVLEERLTISECSRLNLQNENTVLEAEKLQWAQRLERSNERVVALEHRLNQFDRSLVSDHSLDDLAKGLAEARVMLAAERTKNEKLSRELKRYVGIYQTRSHVSPDS